MLYSLIGSNLSFLEILALLIGYMLALMISFCVHEFSHAFVAYKCGDPTAKALGRMSLNPIKHIDPMGFLFLIFFGFGWAKPVAVNPMYFKHYKRSMVLVSLAGVISNIILAFIFSGIYYFTIGYIFDSLNLFMVFLKYFLVYSVIINISLFIFNLIPVFPLDGFNVIKALTKPNNRFIEFMQRYGMIILIIILILPVFDYVHSYITNGILDLFLSFWRLF